MSDIKDTLTLFYAQHDCDGCVTMQDGTQIRRYHKRIRISKKSAEGGQYIGYSYCYIYLQWKNDKVVNWHDIQAGTDLLQKVHVGMKVQRPYWEAYIQCDKREVNDGRGDIYWVTEPIVAPKIIRQYVYFPDREKDHYLMTGGTTGTAEEEVDRGYLPLYNIKVKAMEYFEGCPLP